MILRISAFPVTLIVFALPLGASVPRGLTEVLHASTPAACNAFGLTPQAAVRERREIARRELEAREATRITRQLRATVDQSADPLTRPGATPPAVTVSPDPLFKKNQCLCCATAP